MSQPKDPNQGEGDRISARRYDRNVRKFVDEGHVPDAAEQARTFVEQEPEEAAKAERTARRGPRHRASIDEIVAKGRSVVDRVRPIVARAVGSLRSRFGHRKT